MVRKTKVRIVGEPNLSAHIAQTLASIYALEKKPERYPRAVGRDYSHSKEPGATIYITVKGIKQGAPAIFTDCLAAVVAGNCPSDCMQCPIREKLFGRKAHGLQE